MNILEQAIFDSLTPEEKAITKRSWRQCNVPRLLPVDIPGDYYVATRINIRGCSRRGTDGISRNHVTHALAYKNLSFPRKERLEGQPLCNYRPRNSCDWDIRNEPVTCPRCKEVVEKYDLVQAAVVDSGAWGRLSKQ